MTCFASIRRWSMRTRQSIVAVVILVWVIVAADRRWWPFDEDIPVVTGDDTFFELLLRERYTLGFVRLSLAALALFVVLSVPALIVAGRWLKGFGREGLTADDAAEAGRTIEDLDKQVSDLTAERDGFAADAAAAEARAIRAEIETRLWRALLERLRGAPP